MLILGQGHTVLGGKVVDLGVNFLQSCTQSLVCVNLRNGVNLAVGVKGQIDIVTFAFADGAVANAELSTTVQVALALKLILSHLLQDSDRSFAGGQGCSRGTHGNQAQQHNQSQQYAYNSLHSILTPLISYVSNGIITDVFTNCNPFFENNYIFVTLIFPNCSSLSAFQQFIHIS
jgi:hypothetical protein